MYRPCHNVHSLCHNYLPVYSEHVHTAFLYGILKFPVCFAKISSLMFCQVICLHIYFLGDREIPKTFVEGFICMYILAKKTELYDPLTHQRSYYIYNIFFPSICLAKFEGEFKRKTE